MGVDCYLLYAQRVHWHILSNQFTRQTPDGEWMTSLLVKTSSLACSLLLCRKRELPLNQIDRELNNARRFPVQYTSKNKPTTMHYLFLVGFIVLHFLGLDIYFSTGFRVVVLDFRRSICHHWCLWSEWMLSLTLSFFVFNASGLAGTTWWYHSCGTTSHANM